MTFDGTVGSSGGEVVARTMMDETGEKWRGRVAASSQQLVARRQRHMGEQEQPARESRRRGEKEEMGQKAPETVAVMILNKSNITRLLVLNYY